jgi:hypothetical protein
VVQPEGILLVSSINRKRGFRFRHKPKKPCQHLDSYFRLLSARIKTYVCLRFLEKNSTFWKILTELADLMVHGGQPRDQREDFSR